MSKLVDALDTAFKLAVIACVFVGPFVIQHIGRFA